MASRGHRGGLTPVERWEDRDVYMCVYIGVRVYVHACVLFMFVLRICRHTFVVSCRTLPHTHTHTHIRGGSLSPSMPIDFVSVSLYCNFISVVSADGGPGRGGCVCVLAVVSDEPFCLACLSLSCWQRRPQHYSKAPRRFKHERDVKKKRKKEKKIASPVQSSFIFSLSELLSANTEAQLNEIWPYRICINWCRIGSPAVS